MSVEMFPVILWLGSLVLSVVICVGSTRQSGRFLRLVGSRLWISPDVSVVSTWMIWCHVVTLIMAVSAYLLIMMGMDSEDDGGLAFSSLWVRFYERTGVPAAVVIILAIAVQWMFLYLRARAAAVSEMNCRLSRAAGSANHKKV